MAAKGSIAKAEVIKKIQDAFGDDFIGEVDKKVYVWANDGANGSIQIAISLTCPKVMIDGAPAAASENHDWSSPSTPKEPIKPAEISKEEEATIAEMMKRLGL